MSDLRPIEIDFELHKMVEMARQSLSEPPYEILKRLIKSDQTKEPAPTLETNGCSWSRRGVVLPNGTQLRMQYNSRVHSGEVADGQWLVGGNFYNSPSGAAVAICKTKSGKSLKSLDGWLYWQAKTPGSSKWVSIESLREQVERKTNVHQNQTADQIGTQ